MKIFLAEKGPTSRSLMTTLQTRCTMHCSPGNQAEMLQDWPTPSLTWRQHATQQQRQGVIGALSAASPSSSFDPGNVSLGELHWGSVGHPQGISNISHIICSAWKHCSDHAHMEHYSAQCQMPGTLNVLMQLCLLHVWEHCWLWGNLQRSSRREAAVCVKAH